MAKPTIKIIQALIATAVIVTGGSCTKKIYIPAEREVRDTVLRRVHTVDSVAMRDSIYVAERGDTIIKEVYRNRWHTKTRVDTVYKTHTDTIVRMPEVKREVQNSEKIKETRRIVDRLIILLTIVFGMLIWLKMRKKQ